MRARNGIDWQGDVYLDVEANNCVKSQHCGTICNRKKCSNTFVYERDC